MGRAKCYCGETHGEIGWTVIRNTACSDDPSPFKVYKADVPRDARHFAADLAPFTHATEALAIAAGEAGHFAYLPMHRIYIASGKDFDAIERLRAAVEDSYPHLTFDSEIIEGVHGVRFHTTKYDLDSPLLIELRSFCRAYLWLDWLGAAA